MSNKRIGKLERKLEAAEVEFSGLLLRVLPRVAESGELLFFNARFLPDGYSQSWLPRESEELLEQSQHIIALRRELGLPDGESPASLFLAACAEAAGPDSQRRGPRQLAQSLLSRLPAHGA